MTHTLPKIAPNIHTHILVVDDSASMRDCVRLILKQCLPTARVKDAEDGADALQALEHFPADLIISDLNMPGINGYDLLVSLRQTTSLRSTPVLMMSGDDLDPYRQEFQGDPHVAFLNKPFNVAELAQVAQRLLIHAPVGAF